MSRKNNNIKVSERETENIETSLRDNLKINHFQTYFPILTNFFKFLNYPEANKKFTLFSKWQIEDLQTPCEIENKDTYIKHIYMANVKNNYTKKLSKREVFVKINPILEPLAFIQNEYNIEHENKLSNIHSFLTNKKINDSNNTAYIDSFASFVLSRLTENNSAPTFPLFYGTFSGVADNFKFDITEDFDHIEDEDWFQKGIDDGLFEIDVMENDDKISSACVQRENKFLEEILNKEFIDTDDESISISLSEGSDISSLEDFKDNDKDLESVKEDLLNNEEDIELNFERSNSIETLSIGSNFSIDSIDRFRFHKFCTIKNYPVQVMCIQKFTDTLDNLLDNGYDMSLDEWESILFQVCFGLAVAQREFLFVHNDLHSSNLMFENTRQEYLYFCYKNKYYKIKTFGKITKIIDFGRATFKVGDRIYFSDVFKKNGDAEGQYNYPYNNNINNCKVRPNFSFDLSRLSTTILEHFREDSAVFRLLKEWATDKDGNFLLNYEDDFNLYKIIARDVDSAVPKNQLEKDIFKKYLIKRKDIPKKEFIYYYSHMSRHSKKVEFL